MEVVAERLVKILVNLTDEKCCRAQRCKRVAGRAKKINDYRKEDGSKFSKCVQSCFLSISVRLALISLFTIRRHLRVKVSRSAQTLSCSSLVHGFPHHLLLHHLKNRTCLVWLHWRGRPLWVPP